MTNKNSSKQSEPEFLKLPTTKTPVVDCSEEGTSYTQTTRPTVKVDIPNKPMIKLHADSPVRVASSTPAAGIKLKWYITEYRSDYLPGNHKISYIEFTGSGKKSNVGSDLYDNFIQTNVLRTNLSYDGISSDATKIPGLTLHIDDATTQKPQTIYYLTNDKWREISSSKLSLSKFYNGTDTNYYSTLVVNTDGMIDIPDGLTVSDLNNLCIFINPGVEKNMTIDNKLQNGQLTVTKERYKQATVKINSPGTQDIKFRKAYNDAEEYKLRLSTGLGDNTPDSILVRQGNENRAPRLITKLNKSNGYINLPFTGFGTNSQISEPANISYHWVGIYPQGHSFNDSVRILFKKNKYTGSTKGDFYGKRIKFDLGGYTNIISDSNVSNCYVDELPNDFMVHLDYDTTYSYINLSSYITYTVGSSPCNVSRIKCNNSYYGYNDNIQLPKAEFNTPFLHLLGNVEIIPQTLALTLRSEDNSKVIYSSASTNKTVSVNDNTVTNGPLVLSEFVSSDNDALQFKQFIIKHGFSSPDKPIVNCFIKTSSTQGGAIEFNRDNYVSNIASYKFCNDFNKTDNYVTIGIPSKPKEFRVRLDSSSMYTFKITVRFDVDSDNPGGAPKAVELAKGESRVLASNSMVSRIMNIMHIMYNGKKLEYIYVNKGNGVEKFDLTNQRNLSIFLSSTKETEWIFYPEKIDFNNSDADFEVNEPINDGIETKPSEIALHLYDSSYNNSSLIWEQFKDNTYLSEIPATKIPYTILDNDPVLNLDFKVKGKIQGTKYLRYVNSLKFGNKNLTMDNHDIGDSTVVSKLSVPKLFWYDLFNNNAITYLDSSYGVFTPAGKESPIYDTYPICASITINDNNNYLPISSSDSMFSLYSGYTGNLLHVNLGVVEGKSVTRKYSVGDCSIIFNGSPKPYFGIALNKTKLSDISYNYTDGYYLKWGDSYNRKNSTASGAYTWSDFAKNCLNIVIDSTKVNGIFSNPDNYRKRTPNGPVEYKNADVVKARETLKTALSNGSSTGYDCTNCLGYTDKVKELYTLASYIKNGTEPGSFININFNNNGTHAIIHEQVPIRYTVKISRGSTANVTSGYNYPVDNKIVFRGTFNYSYMPHEYSTGIPSTVQQTIAPVELIGTSSTNQAYLMTTDAVTLEKPMQFKIVDGAGTNVIASNNNIGLLKLAYSVGFEGSVKGDNGYIISNIGNGIYKAAKYAISFNRSSDYTELSETKPVISVTDSAPTVVPLTAWSPVSSDTITSNQGGNAFGVNNINIKYNVRAKSGIGLQIRDTANAFNSQICTILTAGKISNIGQVTSVDSLKTTTSGTSTITAGCNFTDNDIYINQDTPLTAAMYTGSNAVSNGTINVTVYDVWNGTDSKVTTRYGCNYIIKLKYANVNVNDTYFKQCMTDGRVYRGGDFVYITVPLNYDNAPLSTNTKLVYTPDKTSVTVNIEGEYAGFEIRNANGGDDKIPFSNSSVAVPQGFIGTDGTNKVIRIGLPSIEGTKYIKYFGKATKGGINLTFDSITQVSNVYMNKYTDIKIPQDVFNNQSNIILSDINVNGYRPIVTSGTFKPNPFISTFVITDTNSLLKRTDDKLYFPVVCKAGTKELANIGKLVADNSITSGNTFKITASSLPDSSIGVSENALFEITVPQNTYITNQTGSYFTRMVAGDNRSHDAVVSNFKNGLTMTLDKDVYNSLYNDPTNFVKLNDADKWSVVSNGADVLINTISSLGVVQRGKTINEWGKLNKFATAWNRDNATHKDAPLFKLTFNNDTAKIAYESIPVRYNAALSLDENKVYVLNFNPNVFPNAAVKCQFTISYSYIPEDATSSSSKQTGTTVIEKQISSAGSLSFTQHIDGTPFQNCISSPGTNYTRVQKDNTCNKAELSLGNITIGGQPANAISESKELVTYSGNYIRKLGSFLITVGGASVSDNPKKIAEISNVIGSTPANTVANSKFNMDVPNIVFFTFTVNSADKVIKVTKDGQKPTDGNYVIKSTGALTGIKRVTKLNGNNKPTTESAETTVQLGADYASDSSLYITNNEIADNSFDIRDNTITITGYDIVSKTNSKHIKYTVAVGIKFPYLNTDDPSIQGLPTYYSESEQLVYFIKEIDYNSPQETVFNYTKSASEESLSFVLVAKVTPKPYFMNTSNIGEQLNNSQSQGITLTKGSGVQKTTLTMYNTNKVFVPGNNPSVTLNLYKDPECLNQLAGQAIQATFAADSNKVEIQFQWVDLSSQLGGSNTVYVNYDSLLTSDHVVNIETAPKYVGAFDSAVPAVNIEVVSNVSNSLFKLSETKFVDSTVGKLTTYMQNSVLTPYYKNGTGVPGIMVDGSNPIDTRDSSYSHCTVRPFNKTSINEITGLSAPTDGLGINVKLVGNDQTPILANGDQLKLLYKVDAGKLQNAFTNAVFNTACPTGRPCFYDHDTVTGSIRNMVGVDLYGSVNNIKLYPQYKPNVTFTLYNTMTMPSLQPNIQNYTANFCTYIGGVLMDTDTKVSDIIPSNVELKRKDKIRIINDFDEGYKVTLSYGVNQTVQLSAGNFVDIEVSSNALTLNSLLKANEAVQQTTFSDALKTVLENETNYPSIEITQLVHTPDEGTGTVPVQFKRNTTIPCFNGVVTNGGKYSFSKENVIGEYGLKELFIIDKSTQSVKTNPVVFGFDESIKTITHASWPNLYNIILTNENILETQGPASINVTSVSIHDIKETACQFGVKERADTDLSIISAKPDQVKFDGNVKYNIVSTPYNLQYNINNEKTTKFYCYINYNQFKFSIKYTFTTEGETRTGEVITRLVYNSGRMSQEKTKADAKDNVITFDPFILDDVYFSNSIESTPGKLYLQSVSTDKNDAYTIKYTLKFQDEKGDVNVTKTVAALSQVIDLDAFDGRIPTKLIVTEIKTATGQLIDLYNVSLTKL